MLIREARPEDPPAISAIILPTIREGGTYALDPGMSKEVAHAREAGYRAMQFNFVVSTNERAVRLWRRMGFKIVGRLPLAFRHPSAGYVDALVMFQAL